MSPGGSQTSRASGAPGSPPPDAPAPLRLSAAAGVEQSRRGGGGVAEHRAVELRLGADAEHPAARSPSPARDRPEAAVAGADSPPARGERPGPARSACYADVGGRPPKMHRGSRAWTDRHGVPRCQLRSTSRTGPVAQLRQRACRHHHCDEPARARRGHRRLGGPHSDPPVLRARGIRLRRRGLPHSTVGAVPDHPTRCSRCSDHDARHRRRDSGDRLP